LPEQDLHVPNYIHKPYKYIKIQQHHFKYIGSKSSKNKRNKYLLENCEYNGTTAELCCKYKKRVVSVMTDVPHDYTHGKE